MNKTILQGKLRRVRGNLKTEWAKLTDDDRRMLEGKVDQMVGMLQERYGYTQERASKTLSAFVGGYRGRKQTHGHEPTKQLPLAVSLVGLVGAAATVWFVYQRFVVNQPGMKTPLPSTQSKLSPHLAEFG